MDGQARRSLNPISFLQAFIVQGIRVGESGCAHCEGSSDHVVQVGLATSRCLEEVARGHLGYSGAVDADQYAGLITEVKNRIGGQFEQVPGDVGSVRVISHRCPFGDLVKEAPELCRMTSSVFGGIAAQQGSEGATVLLEERIAIGDPGCRVVVHLGSTPEGEARGHFYASPG